MIVVAVACASTLFLLSPQTTGGCSHTKMPSSSIPHLRLSHSLIPGYNENNPSVKVHVRLSKIGTVKSSGKAMLVSPSPNTFTIQDRRRRICTHNISIYLSNVWKCLPPSPISTINPKQPTCNGMKVTQINDESKVFGTLR